MPPYSRVVADTELSSIGMLLVAWFRFPLLVAVVMLAACTPSTPPVRQVDRPSAQAFPPPAQEIKPSFSAELAYQTALKLDPAKSTSIRNANDGRLVGGAALPLISTGLKFNPKHDPSARFATAEVVRALVVAAHAVHTSVGGEVYVNDLSLERGGPIEHHESHQSGRDADVLFYLLEQDGQPTTPIGAFFDPDGRGVNFNDLLDPTDDVALRFDARRNWAFVQALIENSNNALQRIFLAEHLRAILLAHAKQIGAPTSIIQRFSELTCQPSVPHDDHFHFRFFCSAQDIESGCRDSAPIYPWREQELERLGVASKPALPRRAAAHSKTYSPAEARQAAGQMDAKVIAWLDKRQSWLKPPRTGRAFCR